MEAAGPGALGQSFDAGAGATKTRLGKAPPNEPQNSIHPKTARPMRYCATSSHPGLFDEGFDLGEVDQVVRLIIEMGANQIKVTDEDGHAVVHFYTAKSGPPTGAATLNAAGTVAA